MCAALAAGYVGESSVDGFLKRVGREYPIPRVAEGQRRLWLRDDLDAAIPPPELARGRRGGGFVTVVLPLPRFVVAKRLADELRCGLRR
jgi:hypothetical protein